MASPEIWLEVLAWTKALFDVAQSGIDVFGAYQKHRTDKATIAESQRVSIAFSTYSDEEIAAISRRLQECRDRFMAEGSGPQRARCLCSVLEDFRLGNGGILPLIDDWAKIYSQLGCEREHHSKPRR